VLGVAEALSQTTVAGAASLPTALTVVVATFYTGPGTDGYTALATLGKGTRVVLLGTYVDFVRVRASYRVALASGGTTVRTAIGYLLRSSFGALPSLPHLSSAQVPWIEHRIVGPDYPQTITNGNQPDIYAPPGVRAYRWYGSALVASSPLRIVLSANVRRGVGADPSGWSSVGFVNGAWPVAPSGVDMRRLSAVWSAGGWQLVYEPGTDPALSLGALAARADGGLDATLTIPSDGRSVTVVQSGHATRTFRLPRSLYDTTRNTALVSLISPFMSVALTRLSVFQAPSGHPVTGLLPSLAAAAPAGLTVGLWTGEQEIGDPRLLPIIRRQLDMIVFEGSSMGLRPDLALYEFEYPDQLVNFAYRNRLQVRFYLPSYYYPSDYLSDPTWYDPTTYPPDRLMSLLHTQMNAFIARYRGYVTEWMVTGETIANGQFSTDNFWLQNVGLSYIDRVFQWTRAADAGGRTLYIQTADEWKEPQASAIVTHIAGLRSRGIPVDRVGMEMHVRGIDPPARADVLSTVQRLGALGVGVDVVEMDVNLYDVPGTQADQYALQAQIYGDVVSALVASGAGASFTQANLIDPNSWLMADPEADGFPAALAPTLFDGSVHAKPDFYAVLHALQQRSGT
jgi:endo-1,4-beta-xylanase